MTNSKFILRALRGALTAALAGIALVATAQSVRPPAPLRFPVELKWQPMHIFLISYNPSFLSNATPQEATALKSIWKNEIQKMLGDPNSVPRAPAFVVGVLPKNQGPVSYVFSIMDRSVSDGCLPGPNGQAAIDHDYGTCPLRVSVFFSDGSHKYQDIPDYCIALDIDNTPNTPPWSQNRNEFAYEPQSGIVYFRVTQSGKTAPDCNRAIRIGKV